MLVLAQAAPQPQLPEGSSLYLLVLMLALPSIITNALDFVKWLGKRSLEREDKDKEELKERLEKHEQRFSQVEQTMDASREHSDKRFGEVDRQLIELRTEMKASVSGIEAMRSAVQELRSMIDNRFEKQGEFYRLQLKEFMEQVGGLLDRGSRRR